MSEWYTCPKCGATRESLCACPNEDCEDYNHMPDYREVELLLVEETELARKFERTIRSETESFWIPRSLCKSITKFPPDESGKRLCRVKVEEWKLEQLGI